ncbi:MAG: HD domain-containing protein [Myxococcota bacterium]
MPPSELPRPLYSERLDEALGFVADQFRYRIRKGTEVPYVTHLLQVMVTVAEHGGDEDQLLAALLHDYLEDIRGADRSLLAERWGERVTELVEALSDSAGHPRPSWEARKHAFVARIGAASPDVKLISAADKLHNAQSVLRDLRRVGAPVFDRFTASPTQTLWYYRAITDALGRGWAHPLLEELRAVVTELEQEAAQHLG